MADVMVNDLGDVQQAFDAADVDERAKVDQMYHSACDHLTDVEFTQPGAPHLFHGRTLRHDEPVLPAIDLDYFEPQGVVHQLVFRLAHLFAVGGAPDAGEMRIGHEAAQPPKFHQ